jgi:hypothetical protein
MEYDLIILLIIFIILITQITPNKESALFIIQKYINYIFYQLYSLFSFEKFTDITKLNTINGLNVFTPNTPSFKSKYEIKYINYLKKTNPNVSLKTLFNFYNFLQSIVSKNIDYTFINPSENKQIFFSDIELHKIRGILLSKLNINTYKFSNLEFESKPYYFVNTNGREIEPFIIRVDTEFGNIRIYININIRTDVYPNKEYIVINKIKPLVN